MPTLIRVTPRALPPTLRCAYCHGPAEEPLERCETCGTLVHGECAAALGRCATLGCSPRAASKPAAEPITLLTYLLLWFALSVAVSLLATAF